MLLKITKKNEIFLINLSEFKKILYECSQNNEYNLYEFYFIALFLFLNIVYAKDGKAAKVILVTTL